MSVRAKLKGVWGFATFLLSIGRSWANGFGDLSRKITLFGEPLFFFLKYRDEIGGDFLIVLKEAMVCGVVEGD